ncbi:MAG: T9SS type A sorting domain-containing protein, partial [Bacteroidia bacterium]|nr:T9SS type A sorting domain-containing protein [Bacteroidia bacterium]
RRVSGSPKTIITFEADFGSEIKHNFTVGYQVDVEEEVNSSNFNIDIYPNPGTSIFEVLIDFIGNNEEVVVTLISIFGQEIKTYKYYNSQNAETLKLDLTELSSGIYFIKVEFEEWSQIKKIVKH